MSAPALSLPTADAWRSWLTTNAGTAREAWLAISRNDSAGTAERTGLSYEDAVRQAVCFGWIDSHTRRDSDGTLLQRFSPRTRRSSWSRPDRERASAMQRAGLMTPSGELAVTAAEREGR